ncbi:YdcF family protein [Candidatus Falkowbacteria bacterium]|nr:YdcF family protein [Candidatus Falkowbacteria bacterium]
MPKINCLVIILGYNYRLTNNYKHYLDQAAQIIRENRAEYVITTGSYEGGRKDFTDEATFIASYLREHKIATKILIDSLGLTTQRNFENAKEIIRQNEIVAKKIVICCEETRLFKVRILSYLIFKRKLKFAYWKLIEKRRDVLYEKYWNTPRDILGFFLPFIEKQKIQKRKQK